MECPECGKEMILHDSTYSNINTGRSKIGQHTGDIYRCEDCEQDYIDDFLTDKLYRWCY